MKCQGWASLLHYERNSLHSSSLQHVIVPWGMKNTSLKVSILYKRVHYNLFYCTSLCKDFLGLNRMSWILYQTCTIFDLTNLTSTCSHTPIRDCSCQSFPDTNTKAVDVKESVCRCIDVNPQLGRYMRYRTTTLTWVRDICPSSGRHCHSFPFG